MNCAFQCTRAVVFDNSKRKLSMDAVQRMTGCTHIVGGWVFCNDRHSPDYLLPCNWLVVNGQIRSRDQYNDWCFCADDGSPVMDNRKDHQYVLSGVPILKGRQKLYRKLTPDVARPAERQAIAWMADGRVLLWCDKQILTREQLQDRLLALGAVDALMMDGGGSVQGRGPGWSVRSSRTLSTMICMWGRENNTEKEEEHMSKKKTVCLDAGHDAGNLCNKSPDGSFYEHEFALDMSHRIKEILEVAGVQVIEARPDGEKVTLAQRCQIANNADVTIFVSLHTNAASGNGWSSACGWEVYTYSTDGVGAAVARAICKRVDGMGVILRRNPVQERPDLYVLRHTKAPAILIEHGFHTNQSDVALMRQNSYRQMLAQAEAQGILEYLGIKVPKPEQPVPPEKPQEPSEDDRAVQWALDRGIIQGNAQGDLGLDQPVSKMAVLRMMYRVMSQ